MTSNVKQFAATGEYKYVHAGSGKVTNKTIYYTLMVSPFYLKGDRNVIGLISSERLVRTSGTYMLLTALGCLQIFLTMGDRF